MKDCFPTPIEEILSLFEKENHTIYVVGGCVRDFLLGREIHDYDMASSATPQQVLSLCEEYDIKAIPTGIKHGTITMVYKHYHIEITTFRKEGAYHNHRSPIGVYYTNDVKQDAMRRDFTINAMYKNNQELVDLFGGQVDLHNKVIRTVNNPHDRFQEDALRILRCLRFAYTLHFDIEENTYQALQENAHLLKNISYERIRDEFSKIIMSDKQDLLLCLKDAGVLLEIVPEYTMTYDVPQDTPYHCFDVFHHMNAVLNHAHGVTLTQKLALFLHDIAKKEYKTTDEKGIHHFKMHAHASATLAKKILTRLRYDKKTIEEVYTLIDYHDYYVSPKKRVLRKFIYKVKGNFSLAYQILEIQRIDNLGKHPDVIESLNKNIEESILVLQEIEKEQSCFTLEDLCIKGSDLKPLGYNGKQVGILLEKALYYVVQTPTKNNKHDLLHFIGGLENETTHRK